MAAFSEPIRVRNPEGTLHGFLSLTTETAKVLAQGDLIEKVEGDRVTSHLIFRFKDGSVDEETAIFTQRGVFRLISDRHIQRGPFFPHQLDLAIDVGKGTVTTRTTGKDGKEEAVTEHMDLPADLGNGLITPVIKNLSSASSETTVTMIVATPKPRLVTLAIEPRGPAVFDLAGTKHKALTFEIKIRLGGFTGMMASLVGKQPPSIYMWVESGEVPAFLRERGPIFVNGAVLTINLIGPSWPQASE